MAGQGWDVLLYLAAVYRLRWWLAGAVAAVVAWWWLR